MNDGFVKACAACPPVKVADCLYNTEGIISEIECAAKKGVQLIVFPELSITGYTCGDLFFQPTLLEAALTSIERIRKVSQPYEMLIIVGTPIANFGKLYNCAVAISKGKILAIVPKRHLPNYNEFYEMRHFSAFLEEQAVMTPLGLFGNNIVIQHRRLPEFSLGIEICEDLWSVIPPSVALARGGANIIANLSASNEIVGKAEYRRSLVSGQSGRLICGYIYAGAGEGESSTDMVFSGHNIIAENGVVLAENKLFSGDRVITEIDAQRLHSERLKNTTYTLTHDNITVVEFDIEISETALTRQFSKTPFVPSNVDERAEQVLVMQAHGLKKRLEHTGAKTVVLGISGGLDSSLALLVSAKTMDMLGRPHSDIIAVSMPCFGSTKRTMSNAEKLSTALSATFREIDITKAVTGHFADIGHDPTAHDITYENSQARERTQVLMDIANRQNGLVIGTGDLSELALGWATYNGDHMSMYGVNASVPKTLIRHIVRFCALQSGDEALRGTLLDILDTPVSPELLPPTNGEISQITEDMVGPYELHDFFLYYAIRWAFSPRKVLRLASFAFDGEYERSVILKWLRRFYHRFFSQQFKRSCLPDAPKVGSVSLSPRADWRMPSDAVSALWLSELESIL